MSAPWWTCSSSRLRTTSPAVFGSPRWLGHGSAKLASVASASQAVIGARLACQATSASATFSGTIRSGKVRRSGPNGSSNDNPAGACLATGPAAASQRAHPGGVDVGGRSGPHDTGQLLGQAACRPGNLVWKIKEVLQVGHQHRQHYTAQTTPPAEAAALGWGCCGQISRPASGPFSENASDSSCGTLRTTGRW